MTTPLPSQFGRRPAPGMKTFIRNPGDDINSGKWATVAANGVVVGTPTGPGAPGRTGQNLKYDHPNVTHPDILKRDIDIEDLGYDPRSASPPLITQAPVWKPNTRVQSTSARETDHLPVQARRPLEQVRASRVIRRTGSDHDLEKTPSTPRSVSRAEKFRLKRQSANGGSFLDARVYREAFLCAAPESDPCEEIDCWEGGVVYDSEGNVAESGSADQSDADEEEGEALMSSFRLTQTLTPDDLRHIDLEQHKRDDYYRQGTKPD